MATYNWIGGRTNVQGVTTLTPASVTAADINIITYTDDQGNAHTTTYVTPSAPTVSIVSAGVATAWNADPFLRTIGTATSSSTLATITFTSGVIASVTTSVTGTGTLTAAIVTAPKSAYDFNDPLNWLESAVPTAGDDVYILNNKQTSNNSILYGLDQSTVAFSSINVSTAYSGAQIGRNDGYLRTTCTNINLSLVEPGLQSTGAIMININTQSAASIISTNFSSLTAPSASLAPVNIKQNNAAAELYVNNAYVGFCTVFPSDTGQLGTLVVKNSTFFNNQGTLPSTLTFTGSSIINKFTNIGTLNLDASTYTCLNSTTHTTINAQRNSTVVYNSNGTCTTLNLQGNLNCSQDLRAKTFTNTNVYGNSSLNYANGNPNSITRTNKTLVGCALQDVSFVMEVGEKW